MDRIKTRGELKAELSKEIPFGEEMKALAEAEQQLQEMNQRMKMLQEKRAALRRGISIRERKFRDWKGKIPRVEGVPDIDQVLQSVESMSPAKCLKIGVVSADSHKVIMEKLFVRALNGVSGFSKIWLICNRKHGSGTMQRVESGGHKVNLSLSLVDLLKCDEKKGILEISGLDETMGSAIVLDIKPYLSYCEALEEMHN